MLRVSEEGNRCHKSYVANYGQLGQSLVHLQNAANHIFDTISFRTAKEQEKLTQLSSRIQKAKSKIEAISHAKKSITVRSCARYPSDFTDEVDFRSLFGYNDGAVSDGFPVANVLVNGGLSREYGTDGTIELYKFFLETLHEYLPSAVESKESDQSRRGTSMKHAVDAPKYACSSHHAVPRFLNVDNAVKDSPPTPKHQLLPPPPPSLLMNNGRSLRSSKTFNLSPPVKQLHSLNLCDILPDPPVAPGTSANVSTKAGTSTSATNKAHPSLGIH